MVKYLDSNSSQCMCWELYTSVSVSGSGRMSPATPRNQTNDQPRRGQPQEAEQTKPNQTKPNTDTIHCRQRDNNPTHTYVYTLSRIKKFYAHTSHVHRGNHEAPCELSAHRGITIAADQIESKLSKGAGRGGAKNGEGAAVVRGIAPGPGRLCGASSRAGGKRAGSGGAQGCTSEKCRQLRTRLCWQAFPCLPGPQSVRGCSASELCSILPRRTCLRLVLFCTCPPLCAGALWAMPA